MVKLIKRVFIGMIALGIASLWVLCVLRLHDAGGLSENRGGHNVS